MESQDGSKDIEKQANEQLYSQIKSVLDVARQNIAHTVNTTIVKAYWQVGRSIVEFEQKGKRAAYGQGVITNLSKCLTAEFGSGFTASNLKMMRLFYLAFPKGHTLCDQLTWSHYRLLIPITDETIRDFYLQECAAAHWSVRQLQRQIHSLYYERLLASKDKETVRAEISKTVPQTLAPREIIHDPFVLEFLGIKQGEHFLEGDLEQLLISKLQHFLLELGRGYTFVARQKRITLGDKNFYIDLVFYNILARSYVLIDLKIDELTHQDLGQMQMYVNYYTREMMNPGDNPPIGIVLCAEKNDAVVRYTLPEGEDHIFAAKYMTYLPTQEELKQLLNADDDL